MAFFQRYNSPVAVLANPDENRGDLLCNKEPVLDCEEFIGIFS